MGDFCDVNNWGGWSTFGKGIIWFEKAGSYISIVCGVFFIVFSIFINVFREPKEDADSTVAVSGTSVAIGLFFIISGFFWLWIYKWCNLVPLLFFILFLIGTVTSSLHFKKTE